MSHRGSIILVFVVAVLASAWFALRAAPVIGTDKLLLAIFEKVLLALVVGGGLAALQSGFQRVQKDREIISAVARIRLDKLNDVYKSLDTLITNYMNVVAPLVREARPLEPAERTTLTTAMQDVEAAFDFCRMVAHRDAAGHVSKAQAAFVERMKLVNSQLLGVGAETQTQRIWAVRDLLKQLREQHAGLSGMFNEFVIAEARETLRHI